MCYLAQFSSMSSGGTTIGTTSDSLLEVIVVSVGNAGITDYTLLPVLVFQDVLDHIAGTDLTTPAHTGKCLFASRISGQEF